MLSHFFITGLQHSQRFAVGRQSQGPALALHAITARVLMRVQQVYGVHAQKLGVHQGQAHAQMREQLREWLLCCNPSPYTFPLLLDGLSQTLNASPDTRADFMTEVQQIMRGAQVWKGGA